jgi:hypothetical protein
MYKNTAYTVIILILSVSLLPACNRSPVLGSEFIFAQDYAIDTTNHRALVLEAVTPFLSLVKRPLSSATLEPPPITIRLQLTGIDLTTKIRTQLILHKDINIEGQSATMAYDANLQRVFVVLNDHRNNNPKFLIFHLQDGLISEIPAPVQEIDFDEIPAMAYNPLTNKLIVVDHNRFDQTRVLADIDPVTGNKRILSDSNTGSGLTPLLNHIALDKQNQRIYGSFTRESDSAILLIDIASGNRTILSDPSNGIGNATETSILGGVAFREDNNQLYSIDTKNKAIMLVDLTTGDQVVQTDLNKFSGNRSQEALAIGKIAVTENSAYLQINSMPFGNTYLTSLDKLYKIDLTNSESEFMESPRTAITLAQNWILVSLSIWGIVTSICDIFVCT